MKWFKFVTALPYSFFNTSIYANAVNEEVKNTDEKIYLRKR